MPRKAKEPRIVAGRIHCVPGPFRSIISVCCEGPDCEICAEERKMVLRAQFPGFTDAQIAAGLTTPACEETK